MAEVDNKDVKYEASKEDTEQEKSEQPKEEPKKQTSQSKKRSTPTKKKPKPLVHVDNFVAQASHLLGLSAIQQSGFKAYMSDKQYLEDLDAFVPYLEEYTGKKY